MSVCFIFCLRSLEPKKTSEKSLSKAKKRNDLQQNQVMNTVAFWWFWVLPAVTIFFWGHGCLLSTSHWVSFELIGH